MEPRAGGATPRSVSMRPDGRLERPGLLSRKPSKSLPMVSVVARPDLPS